MVSSVTLIKRMGLFEEGVSYILQKYTLSNCIGQMYLFVGPGTLKFKTVQQDISAEAQIEAKHALCPPSSVMSGEEEDIFAKGGYLTLQGKIKEVSKSILFITFSHVKLII